eukprot:9014036-Pyramimonas_sp.AAC.3
MWTPKHPYTSPPVWNAPPRAYKSGCAQQHTGDCPAFHRRESESLKFGPKAETGVQRCLQGPFAGPVAVISSTAPELCGSCLEISNLD